MCFKDVLVDDHVNFNHRREKFISLFALLFPPNSYSVERILSIVFISIFVLGYYMYKSVLAHAHRNGQLL